MVGAVTVRLQMDWTDWNQIKVEIDNKERILHHNLELYLIIEMSCMQEHSGTFLVCKEHSRSFRKVPEPSGTFLVGHLEVFMEWVVLSCIIFIAFRNVTTFPQRRFRNLPEPSGTFLVGHLEVFMEWVVLSCIIFIAFRNVTTFPQRRFRKVPEPSGTFRNILSGAPGSIYGMGCVELYYFYCIS